MTKASNIGSGKSYKIRDVVRQIANMFDQRIRIPHSQPYRENEIWDMRCGNKKIRRTLGWRHRFSLIEGPKKTVNWYKDLWKKNPRSEYFSPKKAGVTR